MKFINIFHYIPILKDKKDSKLDARKNWSKIKEKL